MTGGDVCLNQVRSGQFGYHRALRSPKDQFGVRKCRPEFQYGALSAIIGAELWAIWGMSANLLAKSEVILTQIREGVVAENEKNGSFADQNKVESLFPVVGQTTVVRQAFAVQTRSRR